MCTELSHGAVLTDDILYFIALQSNKNLQVKLPYCVVLFLYTMSVTWVAFHASEEEQHNVLFFNQKTTLSIIILSKNFQ